MMSWDTFFIRAGQPCDVVWLSEIERHIGGELPETYREIIMGCGGGVFHPDVGRLFADNELGCEVIELYGNGVPTDDYDEHSLDWHAGDLMKMWDMPTWGYLTGLAEGDIHTPLLLNRSNLLYPIGALVCVDCEAGEEVVIADSFDDFWRAVEANVAHPQRTRPNRSAAVVSNSDDPDISRG